MNAAAAPAFGRLYIAVRRRALHPRAMLITAAVLFAVTAWQTLDYEPEWLAYPRVWAVVAAVASAAALVALAWPARLVTATAGACAVAAAGSRSVAIFREAALDPPVGESLAAFVIAGASWAAMALLWWQTFAAVVVPWAARRARRRRDKARQ